MDRASRAVRWQCAACLAGVRCAVSAGAKRGGVDEEDDAEEVPDTQTAEEEEKVPDVQTANEEVVRGAQTSRRTWCTLSFVIVSGVCKTLSGLSPCTDFRGKS